MPQKQTKRPKHAEPSLPIAKLDNVPGPEADAAVLNTHYRRVRDAFATHRYDDVIQSCHWCCDMEAPLAYSKPDEARGTRMFCSGRCASAYGAYQAKCLRKPTGQPQPTHPPNDGEELADDASEALPPEPTPEPEPEASRTEAKRAGWVKRVSEQGGRPRRRRVKDIATVVGNEGTGKTTAHKPRAAKAPRTDGKCSKGLHEMTPENTYEYNGGVWCKECRKASRAKSKSNGS